MNNRIRSRIHFLLIALPALLLASLFCPPAMAQQRNPAQLIGQTVADTGSAHYRFERFVVCSDDGLRTWRVNLGIPAGKVPKAGFPALWMLDGNGALMEFDAPLLEELAQTQPTVLVFVGYDNQQRIDSPARTRDYTPSAEAPDEGGAAVGGGADAFLEVLERRIRPQVAQRVAVDADQQALWGHSLGGLFVLHALYTRGGAFQTYVPASPSLWWQQGMMLGAPEQQFIGNNAGHRARVLMMLGGGERDRDTSKRDMNNPRVLAHLKRVSGAPSDAAEQLSARLRQVPGLNVEYHQFEGLGHGPMFRASLMRALHEITGVRDRSGEPRP
ncbi:MAG: alpha/beta hydrolase [Stenotrophomonas sp.]|uniref:alpha/beta hydrolase n=1 Tax=Stenotrophomonas sp. TaxID=69392 RepID=UPI003D6DA26F